MPLKENKRNQRLKTMTINEAIKKYRLPNPTTNEDLEMCFSRMDGKTWHTCFSPMTIPAKESSIGLRAASKVEFEDDDHTIAYAMQQ